MIKKILIAEGKKFYVRDASKDFHTQFGFIKASDLKKARDGSKLISNTKKEFFVFPASFIDSYEKIRRSAQIIPLKDIGVIITATGINKSSFVVDAGSGSGALACFLAHICKKVVTYDLRDDFIDIVKKNKEFLELKNLTIKKGSIYEKISEKNTDLMTLDVPEPWKALETAKNSLKVGGFLVSYSPTIPQTQDFINYFSKDKNFLHVKTVEIIEREWEVAGRRVRPKSQPMGHSGFLTFVRKIGK